MTDPATLGEYNLRATRNMQVTGYGVNVVTHISCPGCAAADWLLFPITAAFDDHVGVQDPRTCSECGRTFRFLVTQEGGGAAMGGITQGRIVQIGGDPVPGYLRGMIGLA